MEKKDLLLSSAKKQIELARPHLHFNGFPLFVVVFTLFLSAHNAGCAFKKPNQYKKEGIVLRPQSKLTAGAGGIERMRLDHPATIPEAILRNQLLSLRYQELSLLGQEKSVYESEEVDQLAPLLVKGLKRVTHNSILYHQIDGKHGKIAGEVFFTHKRLHWRFHTIAGVDFLNQRMRSFSGTKSQGTFWRLVPDKGQDYHKPKNSTFRLKWENWIVSNLNLPKVNVTYKNDKNKSGLTSLSTKVSPQRSSKDIQKPSVSPELGKKLKALKNLHDQNLIQDEEFDRKRKELLDEYL